MGRKLLWDACRGREVRSGTQKCLPGADSQQWQACLGGGGLGGGDGGGGLGGGDGGGLRSACRSGLRSLLAAAAASLHLDAKLLLAAVCRRPTGKAVVGHAQLCTVRTTSSSAERLTWAVEGWVAMAAGCAARHCSAKDHPGLAGCASCGMLDAAAKPAWSRVSGVSAQRCTPGWRGRGRWGARRRRRRGWWTWRRRWSAHGRQH